MVVVTLQLFLGRFSIMKFYLFKIDLISNLDPQKLPWYQGQKNIGWVTDH